MAAEWPRALEAGGRSVRYKLASYTPGMDWKLELVQIPVSDVDRAKAFYTERVGFHADVDYRVNEELRFVQLTPPGSACSIAIGTGLSQMPPGSVEGLQLVVADINAARAELAREGSRSARFRCLTGAHSSSFRIRTATAGPCSSCPNAGNAEPERNSTWPVPASVRRQRRSERMDRATSPHWSRWSPYVLLCPGLTRPGAHSE